MRITTVLFDLDGTLLPMDQDVFVKEYFGRIAGKLAPQGYDPKKLVDTIWRGTGAMVKNDGSMSNEEAFWKCYAGVYGQEKLKDKAIFDDFYLNDFANTKAFCGENCKAKEVFDYCKQKYGRVILASNPIFPKEAMEWRLKFAGLNPEEFDYISDYSNSHYSKPNSNFLKEILEKNNLKSGEVVYFGNSEIEDGKPAKELGIEVYMVGDKPGFFGFMEGAVMDEIPDSVYEGALAIILDCEIPPFSYD